VGTFSAKQTAVSLAVYHGPVSPGLGWLLELWMEPASEGRSRITVSGVEREDENGRVIASPIFLGEIADGDDFVRDVANLLFDWGSEIAVSGDYKWNCVSTTQGDLARALWSVCWTNDDKDENKALARFLLGLGDSEVMAVVSAIEVPSDRDFLEDIKSMVQLMDESRIEFQEMIHSHGQMLGPVCRCKIRRKYPTWIPIAHDQI
jgi:hypothetical protein